MEDNFTYTSILNVHLSNLYYDPSVKVSGDCIWLMFSCWKRKCVTDTTIAKDGSKTVYDETGKSNSFELVTSSRTVEKIKKAIIHAIKISGGKEELF